MVERIFVTLYSRIRVMMTHMGRLENLKTVLWPECAATATKLENIMVNLYEERCAHDKLYVTMPDYAKYIRTFG